MSTIPSPIAGETSFCTECGRPYPTSDLVRVGNSLVCANCKPLFAQKLREGAQVAGAAHYAGFWIRFVAIFLDGLILSIVHFAFYAILTLTLGGPINPDAGPEFMYRYGAVAGLSFLINLGVGMAYQAYFLTRSGATPGKMALRLKVIRADGGPITPALAIGRYLCYLLDGLTFLIGYIIAAFDSEKRALHDHICGTRVIRVP